MGRPKSFLENPLDETRLLLNDQKVASPYEALNFHDICEHISQKLRGFWSNMNQELQKVLETRITDAVDPKIVKEILSGPPFVQISGAFNVRDLHTSPASRVRPRFIFRSGSLEHLNTHGQDELVKMGIKVVFDLRSLQETMSHPTSEIDHVRMVWRPSQGDNTINYAQWQEKKRNFTVCLIPWSAGRCLIEPN